MGPLTRALRNIRLEGVASNTHSSLLGPPGKGSIANMAPDASFSSTISHKFLFIWYFLFWYYQQLQNNAPILFIFDCKQ